MSIFIKSSISKCLKIFCIQNCQVLIIKLPKDHNCQSWQHCNIMKSELQKTTFANFDLDWMKAFGQGLLSFFWLLQVFSVKPMFLSTLLWESYFESSLILQWLILKHEQWNLIYLLEWKSKNSWNYFFIGYFSSSMTHIRF